MQYGTVIYIDPEGRGYGFIEADERSSAVDIFFNGRGVIGRKFDDLHVGDRVSFEIGDGHKGPHAINVVKLD